MDLMFLENKLHFLVLKSSKSSPRRLILTHSWDEMGLP